MSIFTSLRGRSPRDGRIIQVGMPGYEIPMRFRANPAPGQKQWEPLDEPADDAEGRSGSMNQITARLLNLVPRGQHAADALTEPEPACKACSNLDYGPCECPRPCGWPSCMGERARAAAAALAAQVETVAIPALNVDVSWPPRVPIADDYRDLRVFPAVVRGACRVGLTGLGTRGAVLIPEPEFGLDFTAGDWDADFGPEFDEVAERAEAGFVQANRWFHREDTAAFPAVSA